ncbi:hypothetical protein [Chelativorans salis]|uniref:Uncharacterized protein n=1 Tax=Chelativorans salis TaxID=2978478 RepID=A0ABT2LSA9_9HYPH|nr:hypothetical protein [Chelativorans sp. EGI FJ00035]MCT7377425.1 hypothetical protein [Chelativorans sp. EGI FJ00035]
MSDLDVPLSAKTDHRPQWYQGPLTSGEHIDIGSFGGLISRAAKNLDGEDGDSVKGEPIERLPGHIRPMTA